MNNTNVFLIAAFVAINPCVSFGGQLEEPKLITKDHYSSTISFLVGKSMTSESVSTYKFILKNRDNKYEKLTVTCGGICEQEPRCGEGFKPLTCTQSKTCQKREVVLNAKSSETSADLREWLYK